MPSLYKQIYRRNRSGTYSVQVLQCLLEAHGFDAFFVPGFDWGEGRGCANFTYLGEASLAATEMRTLWHKRISHRVFFPCLFPCLCSNSSPYYNQQEVESERKVIGMQRQCIYNYNAYLVTMLKQRPPSLHAREHSFPPSHSHDVIAASHGCTVFSSSSSSSLM